MNCSVIPTRLVPLGSYRYMVNVFAKEKLGNTFMILSEEDSDVISHLASDINYVSARVGFSYLPFKYDQLLKIVDENHIAYAKEGGEWSSYLSRGLDVKGKSMQESRGNYLGPLKQQAAQVLSSGIPISKITHEETSSIIN